MAISDDRKIDYLWKKLGYGASKTDINSIKGATNESIPSPLLLRGDRLWTDSAQISAIMPAIDTDYIGVYLDSQSTTIECIKDLTASANRTWITGLTDWIPPEFGSTYQIKVYVESSGTQNPQTAGSQIFAAGSGNDDEWFFDYQSGILHFIGNNLPNGITGKVIYISGARYIGEFGVSGSSIATSVESLVNNLQNIQSAMNNFEYAGHSQSEINTLVAAGDPVGIVYDNSTGKFIPSAIVGGGGSSSVPYLPVKLNDGSQEQVPLLTTFDGQELISGLLRFTSEDGSRDDIDLLVSSSTP
jgi:hypothetical protein